MKKVTKIVIASAAVAAIATPLIVGASSANGKWGSHGWKKQGHMQQMKETIAEIDSNSDSTIEREELQAWQVKKISDYDKNGDKMIDLSEFEALWLAQIKNIMVDKFQHIDSDGNAKVTLEEFSAPTNHIFERFDRNDDGKVTKNEMKKLHRFNRGHDDDKEEEDENKNG